MGIPRAALFYADGSRVEVGGDDDELVSIRVSRRWLEAPADGLVAVVCEQPATGRHMFVEGVLEGGEGAPTVKRGGDFYYPIIVDGSHEYGHSDDLGAWARMSGLVKCGLWVGVDTYERVLRSAVEWGKANIRAVHRRPSVEVDGRPDGYAPGVKG